MRKLRTLAVAVAALFLFGALAPDPARAISKDTETAIIIVGSIIGGLIVVAIIATIVMRQDKKIFHLDEARPPSDDDPLARKSGLRFATGCPTGADGRPLVCW